MRKNLFYIAILLFLVSAAACSGQAAGAGTGAKEKEAVSGGAKEGRAGDGGEKEAGSDAGQASSDADTGVPREDQLSALDTVIVINVNTDERAVILQNAQSGSRYELSYDGRTQFFDRFGSAISAAQVEAGTIADVRLSVHSGYLKSLNISDNTGGGSDGAGPHGPERQRVAAAAEPERGESAPGADRHRGQLRRPGGGARPGPGDL